MLKTAVILCGQPRNLYYNYNQLYNNIIHPNKADIFLHFWYEPKMYGKLHRSDAEFGKPTTIHDKKEDILNFIKCTIKPKKFLLEEQVSFLYNPVFSETYLKEEINFKGYDSVSDRSQEYTGNYYWNHKQFPTYGTRPGHSLSQWFSWRQACSILESYEMEQNIQYDVIIKLRTDLLFFENIVIDKQIDGIFIKNDTTANEIAINDHFAFGDNYSMKKYLKIYDYWNQYYFYDKLPFNTEIYLGHHLLNNNIKITKNNIKSYILR